MVLDLLEALSKQAAESSSIAQSELDGGVDLWGVARQASQAQ